MTSGRRGVTRESHGAIRGGVIHTKALVFRLKAGPDVGEAIHIKTIERVAGFWSRTATIIPIIARFLYVYKEQIVRRYLLRVSRCNYTHICSPAAV